MVVRRRISMQPYGLAVPRLVFVAHGALACLMLTGPGAFSIEGRRARSAEFRAYGRAPLRAGKV